MPSRRDVIDVLGLSLIGTLWLLPPGYLEEQQAPFALVARVSSIEMPLVLAAAYLWCFFAGGKLRGKGPGGGITRRLLFFAFLGYFFSLIDDGPVDFDSVLTWPEVTSGTQHVLLEVVLHLLTLVFFYLAARTAIGGTRRLGRRGTFTVSVLVLLAFWMSYFQNTPVAFVESLTMSSWYPLDAVEHLLSLAFLSVAIAECSKSDDPRRSMH